MTLSFKHSGAIGDLIYGLVVVKALGGGKIYLNTRGKHYWHKFLASPVPLLRDLLEAQLYVESVEEWNGQKVAYDLDRFRDYFLPGRFQPRTTTLAALSLMTFGLPVSLQDEAWLQLEPLTIKPVVISRSARYQSPFFDWRKVLARYGSRAVFVGLPLEHRAFCKEVGEVEYCPTQDLLELGRVIAGCEIFCGNQSSAFAICEGLKKPALLEISPDAPNCVFGRSDVVGKMIL